MKREEIKKVLPHREPMLLVDEISVQEDGSIVGYYRIPEDAFYCRGHFPGKPIVPGVILCEIMAQSCCMLFPSAFDNGLVVYRGMDGIKFRGEVHPGDLCEIQGRLAEHKGNLFLCAVSLSVAGKRCCQGTLTLASVPH